MKKGTTPAAGKRLVRVLGGRVTSPTLRVINGFGAKLSRRACRAPCATGAASGPVSSECGHDRETRRARAGTRARPTDSTTVRQRSRHPGGARDLDPACPQLRDRLALADDPRDPRRRAWVPDHRAAGWRRGVSTPASPANIPDFQTPGCNGSRVIASAVTNPVPTDAIGRLRTRLRTCRADRLGNSPAVLVRQPLLSASTWASLREPTWSRSRSPTTTATPPSST
jgi:hypothetical protein